MDAAPLAPTFDPLEAMLPYRFMRPADAPRESAGGRRSHVDVEYAVMVGFRPLLLDLTVPETGGTPVPVILYLHPGAWLMGTHKRTAGFLCQNLIMDALVAAGFAVASVQYRLSAEARFPACLHDVSAAVRWLRHFGPELGIDPDRIGSWGESCGGHLSAFLAMNASEPALSGSVGVTGVSSTVQAGVSWYGVTDFLSLTAQALPGTKVDYDAAGSPGSRLVGAPLQAEPGRSRFASPAAWVSPAAAPMLFVHGIADLTTPPRQSETLCSALQSVGVSARAIMVPGADHQLIGVDPAPYIQESVAFLRACLCPELA